MANKSYRQYTDEQAKALCDMYKVVPETYGNGPKYLTAMDTIMDGLFFVDQHGIPVAINDHQYNLARQMYGIDPEVMSNTFYRSFQTVLEKSRMEIFIDQIIHYASTYGMTAAGKKPLTLVPMQEIVVPDVDVSTLKVTVITVLGDGPIVNCINDTLTSVKAPSKRIVENVKVLLEFCDVPLENIKSFELLVMALDYFNEIPGNPKMFLRYLIYRLTGDTLIIKSPRMVKKLKAAIVADRHNITYQLLSKANPVSLATIFLRYKPLFLALKSADGCAPIINRIRRMADTYHQPLSPVTLQNYVQLVLHGRASEARKVLDKADNRDLINLLNVFNVVVNTKDGDPRIFNIRNGRAYCAADTGKRISDAGYRRINVEYSYVRTMLNERLKPTLEGKTFYIPWGIDYAAPVSEKQFLCNIPYGTSFQLPDGDGLTVGVSWVNGNGKSDRQTDLDLHAFTPTRHFGWNSDFTDGKVIYSGDMTNAPAPLGAAECFYVEGVSMTEPVVFSLQKFAGDPNQEFKLYFTATPPKLEGTNRWEKPYTMDPNELLMAPIPLGFRGATGMTLGYLTGHQFVVYGGNLSNSIVPRGDFAKYLEAMNKRYNFALSLTNLLMGLGANVITSEDECKAMTENEQTFVDLSPEALTPSTLLDIVDGK